MKCLTETLCRDPAHLQWLRDKQSNYGSGHYVAHVPHGDAWAFCNDQKVVWSKKTPFDRGYLYVYSAVYQ